MHYYTTNSGVRFSALSNLYYSSLTLVSVCMISNGQEYTAILHLLALVTSPSTARLNTIPCMSEDCSTPEP